MSAPLPHLPPVRRSWRLSATGWLVVIYLILIVLGMVLIASVGPAHAGISAEVPREAYSYRVRIMREAAAVFGVAAPAATFAAQIAQESAWRPEARSRVGAQGLAQFMPATATWIAGAYPQLGASQPFSPAWAVRAMVRYDRWLWARLRAESDCERMAFTLAGYNGGLGWVQRRKARSPLPDVCFGLTCDINPGIHPANQTENARYPARILKWHEPRYVRAGFGRGACES